MSKNKVSVNVMLRLCCRCLSAKKQCCSDADVANEEHSAKIPAALLSVLSSHYAYFLSPAACLDVFHCLILLSSVPADILGQAGDHVQTVGIPPSLQCSAVK